MYNPLNCGEETNAIFESLLPTQNTAENVVILSTEQMIKFLSHSGTVDSVLKLIK